MIEYEIVDKEYGIGCISMKCMVNDDKNVEENV